MCLRDPGCDGRRSEGAGACQEGRSQEEGELSCIELQHYIVLKQFPYRCSFRPLSSKPILPNISSNEGENADEILKRNSLEGLKEKFEKIFKVQNKQTDSNEIYLQYKDRLDHELDIIIDMKYASYFLIVSDYIKWAKENDIPVGPGRGSGAGSLVAWCLSITDVDPIKFNLIFERFLNPDRISMPDFDIDFCMDRREEVLQYVTERYGGSWEARL